MENEFQLLANQNISLKHHQMIIENEIILIAESEKAKNMIYSMKIEVNQSFSTLDYIMLNNNKTVTEFVSIIGSYLSKIEFLQRYLVNGIFDLESLFYYILVIIISVFLTSPNSVRKSRPTIFISIFANIMFERFILNLLVNTIYETDIIDYRSILRSLLLVIIIIEFISHLATYHDLEEKSYVVLTELDTKLSNKHNNTSQEINKNNNQQHQQQQQGNSNYISKLIYFIPEFINTIKTRYSSHNQQQQNDINEISENEIVNLDNSLKGVNKYTTPLLPKKRSRNSAPSTMQSTSKVNNSGTRGRSKKRRRSTSASGRRGKASPSRSVSKDSRRDSMDSMCGEENIHFETYKTPSQTRMFRRFKNDF